MHSDNPNSHHCQAESTALRWTMRQQAPECLPRPFTEHSSRPRWQYTQVYLFALPTTWQKHIIILVSQNKTKTKDPPKKKKVFCSRPLSEHVAELKNYPPINWSLVYCFMYQVWHHQWCFNSFPHFVPLSPLGFNQTLTRPL